VSADEMGEKATTLPPGAPTPVAPEAAPPAIAPTPDLVKVYGWFAIAAELDVSERQAHVFADRERDPLPIEVGHRGVWAYRFALTAWMRRQNIPYRVHLELIRTQRDLQRQRTAAMNRKRHGGKGAPQGRKPTARR